MAFLMEQRHESVMRIDDNIRGLRLLRRFFVDELSGDLAGSGIRHAKQMRTHIEDFRIELSSVIEDIEDLADRAQALDKLAGNREEYVSRNEPPRS